MKLHHLLADAHQSFRTLHAKAAADYQVIAPSGTQQTSSQLRQTWQLRLVRADWAASHPHVLGTLDFVFGKGPSEAVASRAFRGNSLTEAAIHTVRYGAQLAGSAVNLTIKMILWAAFQVAANISFGWAFAWASPQAPQSTFNYGIEQADAFIDRACQRFANEFAALGRKNR